MRSNQDGFTLLELVVTLIILGLMLGMGLPSLSRMAQSSAVRGVTSDLLRDFNMARSHASDLNQYVTLCRRKGTTETCQGAGSGSGWENNGWLVFVDSDRDNVPDTAGTFIRVANPTGAARIRQNSTAGNIFDGAVKFAPDGTVRDTDGRLANVSFDICANSTASTGRTIEISNRGNIRTSIAPPLANGRGCP